MSARADWLILADDLTGAADCAIAFAKGGTEAAVIWGDFAGSAPVLSVDVDSRRFPAQEAAKRQAAAQSAHWRPGTRLYKKIDSTLRGQMAAELKLQLATLARAGETAFLVVAPAFPATGRTTEGGRVMVDGKPLETTPLWARDHSYDTGDLKAILAGAGIETTVARLEEVREGEAALQARMAAAKAAGFAAIVCDGATEADLDLIAGASLGLDRVFWVGSAGLAAALARKVCPGRSAAPVLPRGPGGVLMVVGSLAEASRLQAAELLKTGEVKLVSVSPALLDAGPDDPGWRAAQAALDAHLGQGGDVLLELALTERPDLARGPDLAARLAALVAPATPSIGALAATGGETACALLARLGVYGIALQDEVEPGVPLGQTIGAVTIPVVTKAGAFGGGETLKHCLDRLRKR